MKLFNKYIAMVVLLVSTGMLAQQDPHFTQYIYNTQSINPAYVGSKGFSVINLLVRSQWVGVEGAPQTQSFSYDSPIGNTGIGLGVNVMNDKIGPATETFFDVSGSYTIRLNEMTRLSLGMKLGGNVFNVDWNKVKLRDQDDPNTQENISKFLPTLGAGVFLYQQNWYIGASVPNFIQSDYYDPQEDDSSKRVAEEKMHMFFIAGYVFHLSENVQFKPATLAKVVSGAPLSLDVSANFLINRKITAGLSWRLDDSVSALLGFEVTDNFHIGYAYDLTTTNFSSYNSGTHELMLRYEAFKERTMKSPRFF